MPLGLALAGIVLAAESITGRIAAGAIVVDAGAAIVVADGATAAAGIAGGAIVKAG